MTRNEALAIAKEYLREEFGDGPPTIILQPDETEEHPNAWAVLFDTQEHMDTGDITQAPIQRVVIVPKDGTPAHTPPTAFPVSVYLEEVASGAYGWLAKGM